jgi:hypothetical protein
MIKLIANAYTWFLFTFLTAEAQERKARKIWDSYDTATKARQLDEATPDWRETFHCKGSPNHVHALLSRFDDATWTN